MQVIDKRILNFLVIIVLSLFTFIWTFWIFHIPFVMNVVITVSIIRIFASLLLFKDYSLSWRKSSQKTFLLKSMVYLVAFLIYMPIFYGKIPISFFMSELFYYLFLMNFMMYVYYAYFNKSKIKKNKDVIIYGAGKAGLNLEEEFSSLGYKVNYFVDDDILLQKRSIDGIKIISKQKLIEILKNRKIDLLVIAMPSTVKIRMEEIYNDLHMYFHEIKILPALDSILINKPFEQQLQELSVSDLLVRYPKDLDKEAITSFIKNKIILITGAGGSIGSEIVKQCIKFQVKQLILLDHSEYNLYQIEQEVQDKEKIVCVMQSIVNKEQLQQTFEMYKPDIVIHAAAYKHVPLVEENMSEAIWNNVIGTQTCIDLAIENKVEKFILISTDKAVRPTNVMGATKRICELYAQNAKGQETDIVSVRFGNVLGSSGSVIPKFQSQIKNGQNVTVTHPDITRYFMLISEACELVLQAGAIGQGGEIFILDMGDPIKIVDLAEKMITLSGRDDIKIEFTGLRAGEKLYEELLINESDMHTEYTSITVSSPTFYEINELKRDIKKLVASNKKLEILKHIVPEFNHQPN